MPNSPDHVILICATCQGARSSADLHDMLKGQRSEGFDIRTVDCMAACDFPATVGFQAKGKAQYLFDAIETAHEVAALAAFARQYHQSDGGWTKASDRPRPLLTKTLARLPRLEAGHTL